MTSMRQDYSAWWIAVVLLLAGTGSVIAAEADVTAEQNAKWVLDSQGQRPEPKVAITNVCAWPNLTKMLDTLDAERFCSGHSDPTDRKGIERHIAQVKTFQEKVKALVAAGKTLDEAKAEFAENEGGFVESIYNEVKAKKTGP